jgi:hypothetical protein
MILGETNIALSFQLASLVFPLKSYAGKGLHARGGVGARRCKLAEAAASQTV